MALVDSSVWIHFLRGDPLPQVDLLASLLETREALIADLVATEVLQGVPGESVRQRILRFFRNLDRVIVSDFDVAVAAADHFRFLRSKGITVRKTIDTLIATRCILNKIPLLHADRDFDAFEKHLALRVVR